MEHSGDCAGTAEYYRNTRDALGGCAGIAEFYKSTGDTVLVQNSTVGGLVRLCWYSRVL